VASPKEWEHIYVDKEVSVSFRISLANTKSPHAVSAWLRIGELQSKHIQLNTFDKSKFKKALLEIKKLAIQMPDDFSRNLQIICAKCGVPVVYTPTLPKVSISGATRWFRYNPIIQLTTGFITNDHFWYTFFHEAAHVILHGKKEIFLENLNGTVINQEKEEEVNAFAIKIYTP